MTKKQKQTLVNVFVAAREGRVKSIPIGKTKGGVQIYRYEIVKTKKASK